MMDIVERLRRDADRMGSTDRIGMAHEAADEIERLRADVARLTDLHERIAASDEVAKAYQWAYFHDFPTVTQATGEARRWMLIAADLAADIRHRTDWQGDDCMCDTDHEHGAALAAYHEARK